MKKLLTVVLVIAVLFTYSVGAAFAVPATPEQTSNLRVAQTYAEAQSKIIFDSILNKLDDNTNKLTVGAYEIKRSVTMAQKDNLWNMVVGLIAKKTDDAAANWNGAWDGLTGAALAQQVYPDFLAEATLKPLLEMPENSYFLAKAQFDADYADLVGEVNSVDMTQYSSTTPEGARSYADRAKDVVELIKADLAQKKSAAETLAATQGATAAAVTTLFNAKGVMKTVVDDNTDAQKIEGVVDAGGNPVYSGLRLFKKKADIVDPSILKTYVDANGDILTKDQEALSGLVDAAAIAAVKAEAQSNAATAIQADPKNRAKAEAYVKLYNYLADNGVVKEVAKVQTFNAVRDYEGALRQTEELMAFANKYKAEMIKDKSLARGAEYVDAIVKKALTKLYVDTVNHTGAPIPAVVSDVNKYDPAMTIVQAMTEIKNYLNYTADKNLEYAKKSVVTALEKYKAKAKVKCYEREYNVVASRVDAAIAKVEQFDNLDDVVKFNLSNVQFGTSQEVYTKDQVNTNIFQPMAAVADIYAKVERTVALMNSGYFSGHNLSPNDPAYIIALNEGAPTGEELAKGKIYEILGNAGARTVSEVKAANVDVNAVISVLSTRAGLDAALKEAREAINALPVNPTVADKDAAVKTYDLYRKYLDMNGAKTLNDELTIKAKLMNFYRNMFADFARKLNAVDKTDKAAVKALAEEADAATYLGSDEGLFAYAGVVGAPFDNILTPLDKALLEIRRTEKSAVEKAINSIPLNITEASRPTVENARKLYDAYVEEYTDYAAAYRNHGITIPVGYLPAANIVPGLNNNALVDLKGLYSSLYTAEAVLGISVEDPVKSVESLKITARSVSKKGSITVKWSVVGDTKYVKGYEVWRSTKKTTGFKKMITTTKTSYKNSKKLKKGVKYYYKVRAIAYTADKVKVKSDWSNKAFRVAK